MSRTRLHIETTTRCNGRCVFCPHTDSYVGRNAHTMSDDLFREAVESVRDSGLGVEVFLPCLQGEPLMDPKLPQRIKYARQRLGFHSIIITTNCSLLTPKRAERLLDAVKGLKVHFRLAFHHAEPARFEERTGLRFEVCLKNLRSFLRATRNTKDMERQIVTSDCPEIARPFWEALGMIDTLGEFTARYMRTSSRAGSVKALRKSFPGRDWRGCPNLFGYLYINVSGEVVGCCEDWEHRLVFGSVRDKPVKEIAESIPEQMKLFEQKEDFPCKQCDIQKW